MMRPALRLILCACLSLLGGCGLFTEQRGTPVETIQRPLPTSERQPEKGSDIAFYALSLIDTGYRFGGKNPEAGLDCSGMVSYIYQQAAGLRLSGSAADLARRSRPVASEALRPGDLVFFNTRNKAYSHVGIYIGDARFVHAPSTNGRVRIDRLADRYYAQRFEAAHTLFD